MRDFALLAGILAMIPFAFGRPHIGALLWCWTAFLVPNSYMYGFARPIHFNFIVVILTLIFWVLSKEPVRVPWNRTTVLLLMFAVFGTMSAVFAIGPEDLEWVEWNKFYKLIFFAVVVVALFNTRSRIYALLFAIFLSVGFHGIVEGLKFILSGGGHHIWGPGDSILGDNNHFALAILCLLPLAFYLFRQTTHPWVKLALLGSTTILFFTVVGTFSRGGLIGLGAITAWAFLRSPRKLRFMAIAVPVALMLFSFAPDRWFSRMDTIATADQDESFMGRVIAWKQSTLIALDNPILGGGFHAVQDFTTWTTYRLTRFRDLDFIATADPDPNHPHAAHSIYFQVLGDLGFVGLILFAAIGITAWKNTSFIVRQTKSRPDLAWAGHLAQNSQYSLIAYFVSGAALSMAYFEMIYVLFAILASLRSIVERELAAQTTEIPPSP